MARNPRIAQLEMQLQSARRDLAHRDAELNNLRSRYRLQEELIYEQDRVIAILKGDRHAGPGTYEDMRREAKRWRDTSSFRGFKRPEFDYRVYLPLDVEEP